MTVEFQRIRLQVGQSFFELGELFGFPLGQAFFEAGDVLFECFLQACLVIGDLLSCELLQCFSRSAGATGDDLTVFQQSEAFEFAQCFAGVGIAGLNELFVLVMASAFQKAHLEKSPGSRQDSGRDLQNGALIGEFPATVQCGLHDWALLVQHLISAPF